MNTDPGARQTDIDPKYKTNRAKVATVLGLAAVAWAYPALTGNSNNQAPNPPSSPASSAEPFMPSAAGLGECVMLFHSSQTDRGSVRVSLYSEDPESPIRPGTYEPTAEISVTGGKGDTEQGFSATLDQSTPLPTSDIHTSGGIAIYAQVKPAPGAFKTVTPVGCSTVVLFNVLPTIPPPTGPPGVLASSTLFAVPAF